MRQFLETFGYYDIFLVDNDSGRIVYSVFKELDFGTSLLNGPWAKTNFGEAFRKARDLEDPDGVVLVDYAQYIPSYSAPASFIASPVYDGKKKIGVLMFQMPLDRINSMMSERAGLGETGETYLVGPDQLMRSDSYLDPKTHSVIASFKHPETGKVATKAAVSALGGVSGTTIIKDYNGNPVVSAYTPVNVLGLTWALMAEIDVAEAFVPRVKGHEKDFFAEYVSKYGYYDLFLINPDGFVFYTAAKESDYQTNMVDGKYASSGLGKLVRQVLDTKEYGVADFAPYGPSNNEPAGFVAQPFIYDGQVQMVAALQLSIDAINAVMQQRDGMGETGETYLIGSDKLMRSDSFLDSIGHTVKASFADPAKGSVNTVGAEKVIAGETGSEIIVDYNGNEVLSAFAPIDIGGVRWGLLAEIDKWEAFAAEDHLRNLILIVGLFGAVAIAAVGYFAARSISNPIVAMTGSMRGLAAGDLETEIGFEDRGDEIGQMAGAVGVFKTNAIERVRLEAEQKETAAQMERDKEAARQRQAEQERQDREREAADAKSERERAEQQAEAERVQQEKELAETRQREEMTALRTKKMADLNAAFESQVTGVLETVSSAATELRATAGSMSTIAQNTRDQSETMAASSQLSEESMQSVAAATEQLRNSIDELSAQTSLSSAEVGVAAAQAEDANARISTLVAAADRVQEVVSLIADIASQTNLLALNATIEAQRAGEAGSGFAVVASEVKDLADQTGKATKEIDTQVGAIREAVNEAAKAIQQITKAISDVGEYATASAAGVEEQAAATKEIARNASVAAEHTRQVADLIKSVSMSADETLNATNEVVGATDELSGQSMRLERDVKSYLEEVQKI